MQANTVKGVSNNCGRFLLRNKESGKSGKLKGESHTAPTAKSTTQW